MASLGDRVSAASSILSLLVALNARPTDAMLALTLSLWLANFHLSELYFSVSGFEARHPRKHTHEP